MHTHKPKLIGVPKFQDSRGWFSQIWSEQPNSMVQTNISFSKKGVIRGLHYHHRQDDFFYCPMGKIMIVTLDVECGCRPLTWKLNGDGLYGLYVPAGIAHGFEALEDSLVCYNVTNQYDGTDEFNIPWNDPRVVDLWHTKEPILSERDEGSNSSGG